MENVCGAGSRRAGQRDLAGEHRGVAPWLTGAYDPALNLVYWGTSNPSPVFYGPQRQGDNLYTSSMLAFDADTGKIKWHFQFTPHDVWDYDGVNQPMLLDNVRLEI